MRSAFDRFTDTVAGRPQQTALHHLDERVTFAELHAAALAFAARVDAQPQPWFRPTLVVVENSPVAAAAVLGVWATGAPVGLVDVQAPAAHVEHAIATLEPRCVVNATGGPLAADTGDVPVLEAAEPAPGVATPRPALATAPASVVFTSGSTGLPKGATQSHANLTGGCATVAAHLGIGSADRILCPVPWSFDYGFMQLQSMAFLGTPLVLPASSSARDICAAIEAHRPTVLAGTPSVQALLMQGLSPIRGSDISSLRSVTNTGGAIAPPVFDAMLDVFAGKDIFLNYGMTESYRTSCLPPALAGKRPACVGAPIPGVDICIVREDGSIAAAGETGEIVHRGSFVFRGYWANPEATARVLRPDPLAVRGDPQPGAALFTGDLGRLGEDGLLYYEGRRDHVLKSMGVRVNPGEVEALLHASGLVSEAAVFGKPHDLLYHEIWAAVVPLPEHAERIKPLLNRYARERLSPYMAPRRILVKADQLPRTSSGKTDYPALRREADASG